MEERHVKGVHLVNVFKFVKWKRGILGVKRFLEEWHGQAGHQKITEQAFIEKEWYDDELYLELLNVADKSAEALYVAKQPRSPVTEAFRALRTNLEFAGIFCNLN